MTPPWSGPSPRSTPTTTASTGRKVWRELARQGVPVARCTVERMMRVSGCAAIPRAKATRTTITRAEVMPEDKVNWAFTATAPNQLWVADLTYVRTFAGWVYVAFMLDVFPRRVVGSQV